VARKLTVMVLGTSAVTLTIACAVFAVYDFATSRSRLVRDVSVLADVIGSNSTAAIAALPARTRTSGTLRLRASSTAARRRPSS
jgi:hypothetical protein